MHDLNRRTALEQGLAPIRGARRLVDADGLLWQVYEREYADTGPSLFFESEGAWRRVRRYPATWRELTDADLLALSRTT